MDFRHVVGHEDIISRFRSSIEAGKVSHAYIISGEEGSGRSSLAYCFAKTLQCEQGGKDSCDTCPSCHQMDTGNHPDVIYVTHSKPGVITVDEIREQVVNNMDIKPYKSRYKIYIIKDGEKMNVQAENALLKTIEEPPEYGIVIIITTNPDKLLPTIRSRCIEMSTKPVREKDIRDYLINTLGISSEKANFAIEYAQGNLGKAISLATNEEYQGLINSVIDLETKIYNMDMEDIADAITGAEHYKMSIGEYLDLMMVWYRDILVLKVTGNPDKILFKNQYSIISEQAKYLSFNELEDKSRAIENAKVRIQANARLDDIMRLLILTLKEI